MGFTVDTPWSRLPAAAQKALLYGYDEQVHVRYKNRYGRERSYYTSFEGAIPYIERRHAEAESDSSRERFAGFMREVPCPACHGARLKPISLAVTVDGRSIADYCALPIGELAKLLLSLELSDRDKQIAGRILKEVNARLGFLLDVGLDYLSLDRASATLAGGEAQRIRLATQIGSGLVGVLYVLDEPSIGLHQRDNHRLLETLIRLRDLGNTLIVVEHDEDTIRAADWVVDIGPRRRRARRPGGRVRAAGGPAGQRGVADRRLPDRPPADPGARPRGARGSAAGRSWSRAPASTTCATWTWRSRSAASSRSPGCPGRASPRWSTTSCTARWPRSCTAPGSCRAGTPGSPACSTLDKVVHVDQGPIGRTPRSNPATYTGVFDHVRRLFAADHRGQDPRLPAGPVLVQRQGRPVRGVLRRRHDQDRDAVPAGRVRALRGLPRRPVQHRHPAVHYKGKTIADVLDMPIEEAAGFFEADARHPPAPEDAGRRRPGLRPARPARPDAVRRRGAAGQAGLRTAAPVHRPDHLRAGRAHHRAALRRHPQAARRARPPGRRRATRSSSSSTTWT